MNRRDTIKHIGTAVVGLFMPFQNLVASNRSIHQSVSIDFDVSVHARHGLLNPYSAPVEQGIYMRMDRLQKNGYSNTDEDLWLWYFNIGSNQGYLTFTKRGNLLESNLTRDFRVIFSNTSDRSNKHSTTLLVNTLENNCTFYSPSEIISDTLETLIISIT